MELQILKSNLKQALDILKRISSKNSSLPILDNVLLETKKNYLELSSTDLELGVKYQALSKIKKQGKVAIPVNAFSNLINSLPDKPIDIKQKENDLSIKCEDYKANLKGLDPKEFPIIPKVDTEVFTTIKSSILLEGLSQVIDVVSPSKVRPEISGVYICFEKGGTILAATDSFRLAEKELNYSASVDEGKCIILPHKTAKEIINIFTDLERKLEVYFSENQIMLKAENSEKTEPNLKIVSKLVEGEYPDYREIIPDDYQTRITVSKSEFNNRIKTASLFGGKVNEIECRVKPDKKGLEILSQDPDLGKNKSFLSAKVEGEETEASFNWRFLRDGLSNIDTKEVVFELNGSGGAAVLKPTGEGDYIYVVMPIKAS